MTDFNQPSRAAATFPLVMRKYEAKFNGDYRTKRVQDIERFLGETAEPSDELPLEPEARQ